MIAALPTGWRLAVLVKQDDERYAVGVLPAVAIYSNGDVTEPIVAMQDGQLLRASQLEYEVICLSSPGEDVAKVARAMLAVRGDVDSIQFPDESMVS